jgi:2-amino-4-hydroxy-6-hydroxymethyldihydropteridine diphosphokinase
MAIYVGLGSNLPSATYGQPRAVLEASLRLMAEAGVRVVACSSWWRTAPVPVTLDQPWYTNRLAEIATALPPPELMKALLDIEARLGRTRDQRWEARVIDLDLIDYDGRIEPGPVAILPHPRMAERGFVLKPLAELAPGWRHPVTGTAIADLIAALPPEQVVEQIA